MKIIIKFSVTVIYIQNRCKSQITFKKTRIQYLRNYWSTEWDLYADVVESMWQGVAVSGGGSGGANGNGGGDDDDTGEESEEVVRAFSLSD